MALGEGGFYHLHFGIPAGQGADGFTLQPTLIHRSPTSSRKSVLPSAASNLPARRCSAPVKAPFSCPQSSEAINDCYNCHAARSNNSFNLQVSVLEQIPEC
jgi:hypothetical protein